MQVKVRKFARSKRKCHPAELTRKNQKMRRALQTNRSQRFSLGQMRNLHSSYKRYWSTKLSSGNDWETVMSKYEDIAGLFIANYPEENCEEFPNAIVKWKFTKERVASKIMKLKLGFRRAIDSGKKSGDGRMVGALFNECYKIWSGSPAVEALNIGLETSMINERSEDSSSLENEDSPCGHRSEAQSTHEEDGASCDSLVESIKNRASFNIATSGVSAPVGPSSGPVVKQKNLILPQ